MVSVSPPTVICALLEVVDKSLSVTPGTASATELVDDVTVMPSTVMDAFCAACVRVNPLVPDIDVYENLPTPVTPSVISVDPSSAVILNPLAAPVLVPLIKSLCSVPLVTTDALTPAPAELILLATDVRVSVLLMLTEIGVAVP